ncbi:MAG TPA: hypothetical protein VG935_01700 [Patescibacteria group bacterium]|nr:hypothetical protein [Patescibacteria group bacterium]
MHETFSSNEQHQELGYVSPARFISLCERVGSPAPIGQIVSYYRDILNRHSEPQRYYHTLTHVNDVLGTFYLFPGQVDNVSLVEVAGWMHDVIQGPQAEVKSADYAVQMIRDLQLPSIFEMPVHDAIVATEHKELPKDPSAKLLVNADLLILASSPPDFDKYEAQIRQEYSHYTDEEFIKGRLNFWDNFLGNRDSVYTPGVFYDRFEQMAQENIARSRNRLRSGLIPRLI